MSKDRKKRDSAVASGSPKRPALPEAPASLPALPGRESEGQRMLREQTESLAELAAKVEVNKATIHRWRTGEKVPGPAARAKLQAVLRIPTHAWGLVAGGPPKPADPAVSPAARAGALTKGAGRAATLDDAFAVLDELHAIDTRGLLATDQAKIAAAKAQVIGLIHKWQRELKQDEDTSEHRMVEHASFRRVLSIIREEIDEQSKRRLFARLEQEFGGALAS